MTDRELELEIVVSVCRERLATHGPNVLAAAPMPTPNWLSGVPLRDLLPHYWVTVFDERHRSGDNRVAFVAFIADNALVGSL